MSQDHDSYMAMAIEEARAGRAQGEQPFGSIVVRDGAVISRTRSLKVSTGDITDHAELLAVRRVTGELGLPDLAGCVFYTSCEPCPMCLGAMFNAKLGTLVLGARLRDLGQLAFHFHDYSVESFAAMTGWDLTLVDGIRSADCTALYADPGLAITR